MEECDTLDLKYMMFQGEQTEDNKDLKYDRNFIRNVILPKLKKRFPDFDKGVKSSLSAINEDYSLLMSLIYEKIKPYVNQEDNSYYIIPDHSSTMLTWFHYLKQFV